MKKYSVIYVLGLLVFMSSCFSSNKSSSSVKKVSFKDAKTVKVMVDAAEGNDKPIFLDFYTTWCAPCKWMDQDVFTNPDAVRFLNKNFNSYKIDAEKRKAIADKYNVMAYPTIIFLDKKGKVMQKYVGMTSASKIIEMGKKTLQEIEAREAN